MASGIRLAILPLVAGTSLPLPRLERRVARQAICMFLGGVERPVPEAPEVSPAKEIRFGKMRRWLAMLSRRLVRFRLYADHSAIRWQAVLDCARMLHYWGAQDSPREACSGIEFFQTDS